MIDELEWVRHERPEVEPPSEEARTAARRALDVAIAAERSPRRSRASRRSPMCPAHVAAAIGLLVVAAVVVVFVGLQRHRPTGAAARGGFELVYQAEATAAVPVVNQAAIARTLSLIRQRIAAILPGTTNVVLSSSGNRIFVHVSGGTRISRGELMRLVGTSGRLFFYDWEANALTPTGKPVASLLTTQDPAALEISQGGSTGPGAPGAGSMGLYRAVALAAKQPYEASQDNSRPSPEYFAFGAPGSAACARAATYYGVSPVVGQHCYLAGPLESRSDLASALPPGVSSSQAQVLTVQRGTVVLQAVPASYGEAPAWSDPSAQYFVLRDNVALFGTDITNPTRGTDVSRAPDVTFGFTARGAAAFQNLTAQIAHRGDIVSGFGQQLNQHFAVVVDTQLITVPSIDFKTYPNGIPGSSGGDLTGNFTVSSARALATELRLGALPVNLKLISSASS